MNEGFANHRLSEITSDGKRLYASSTYEGLYGGVFVSSDGGLQWSLRANEEALQGRNLHSLTASLGGSGRSIRRQRRCDFEISGRGENLGVCAGASCRDRPDDQEGPARPSDP